MHHDSSFSDVELHLVNGRYKSAQTTLSARRHELLRVDLAAVASVTAEIDLASGDLEGARRAAERQTRESERRHIRIVAHRILGDVYANLLDFEESLSHYRIARTLARENTPDSLKASTELSFWGWFSGVLPLASTQSEFAEVRKAVARSAHPHHIADLRLCVLRVEARRGTIAEARRHWKLAHRLLASHNNPKLQSQLELDGCLLALLSGDLGTALDHVRRAHEHAESAGFFRGLIAARIDHAHVLHAMGALESAHQIASEAVVKSGDHRQLKVAALDCLANILLAQEDLSGAEALFEEIAHLRPAHGTRLAPHWDVLSELSSRTTLAKLRQRKDDQEQLVARGLKTATTNLDRVWVTRMHLELAELKLRANDHDSAVEPLTKAAAHSSPSPEIIARTAAVRALAALKSGERELAGACYQRSMRIAEAMGNAALASELPADCSTLNESAGSLALDDALALVELAGYPHVLAHEAYALLGLTGAAARRALVARGETDVRLVAAHEWTDADALAAARDPDDRLRIDCGSHRDESWEIVAELRDTLNDRCTGVAIRKLVDTAVTLDRYRREEKQRTALWPADTLETDGGLWVSEQMTELLSIARRIAPSDISVLLTGETGTGKEVLARAIHRASGRAAKPFVPFNCTAVPREMLESQLFGYRKGAFTGANDAFDGVIRAAAGGTLFLDEIAEIGPELQPKLLRFLETHEVHGLGEAQPVKVDVRVIAATNADLEALVTDGKFREDLFYRLNVVRLRLPPLRERREEIPSLVDHYLRKAADEQKKGRLTLDDETLEYLVLYSWPGNVRQLVNEVSRIVAYADPDSTVTPALLSPEIQTSRRTIRVHPGDEPEISVRLDQPLNDAIEMIERMMVLRALERAHGNYENAARLLGISRKGLFLKRRRWGMQRAAAS